MRIDPEELDHFAAAAIEALPVVFYFNSKPFHGAMGSNAESPELVPGGVHERYSFSLVVRKRDLPAVPPAKHDLLTISGKQYEVLTITTSEHDPNVTYAMGAEP